MAQNPTSGYKVQQDMVADPKIAGPGGYPAAVQHPQGGYPTNGYPKNGYPANGHPQNGYAANGNF